MYTETVTLKDHKVISGNGARGAWSKSIFTDQANREFSIWTNNAEGQALANQLVQLLNQPVTVEFEATQRQGQNGRTFTNYDLKSFQAGGVSPVTGTQYNGQQPTEATPPQQAAPPPQGRVEDVERENRIGRYAAYERAVITFGAEGLAPLQNFEELIELSEKIKLYAEQGPAAVLASFEVEDEPVEYDAAVAGPVA